MSPVEITILLVAVVAFAIGMVAGFLLTAWAASR